MSLHFNILTDDKTMINYLALYLSIKGFIPKGESKRKYPSAKQSLSLMGLLTTDDKLQEDIRYEGDYIWKM